MDAILRTPVTTAVDLILWTILWGIIASVVFRTFRIVRQFERAVVFRLGRYHATKEPGFFILVPFIDRMERIDMRTQTISNLTQEAITEDNVPIKAEAALWYKIVGAEKSVIEVENVRNAVQQLALVSLRDKLGRHPLSDILKNEKLSEEMLAAIKPAAEAWGVEVERVQMRNFHIPEAMQRAMAQVAEAMREKEARLIKADAEKESALKFKEAADIIASNPYALELRRFHMITEVGAEQNTSTILMMPSQFVTAAEAFARSVMPPKAV